MDWAHRPAERGVDGRGIFEGETRNQVDSLITKRRP